jgi:ABC-type glycerol-3-phosphate transport system permease component
VNAAGSRRRLWRSFSPCLLVLLSAFKTNPEIIRDQYVRNWNHIFAGVVVLSLPVTVLYVIMQRRFVKGLTAGAVK